MSERTRIHDGYFHWLLGIIRMRNSSFDRLLYLLYTREFEVSIPMDANRAVDGKKLRRIYSENKNVDFESVIIQLPQYCTMLEMMVALAHRCEEQIMSNTEYGDRTQQWFMEMLNSLGLSRFDDEHYDEEAIDDILYRFGRRDYAINGAGGLFTVQNPLKDMRNVEIWSQLCWYLDEQLRM